MVTVGKCLSHYRIVEELGHGGMGVVYRARDEHLPRDVALKVLPAGLFSDETARSRFRREAQTLSQLNHPNIAMVLDFDRENGVDFLAMEFVEGETLADKVAAGPLPEKDVITLGTQIAEALEDAHEHGIIHRDLKPGNVMVTPKGRAKVLDFGLAKLTRPESRDSGPGQDAAATASLAETQGAAIVGTLPYMSPEQLQGKPADARTDVYALGAVLYEMATGRRPFPQEQTSPLIAAIVTETPKPARELNAQVSKGLEAIIRKAMENSPQQRYQSAKKMREDLARLGVQGSVLAAQKRKRMRRGVILALAGVLVVTVAVVVYWIMRPLPPPRIARTVQLTNSVGGKRGGTIVTDGPRIYFTETVGDIGLLRQVSVTGGDVSTVSSPQGVLINISPDGSQFFFDDTFGCYDCPLKVMPATGGIPRKLGGLIGRDAAWSPDGRRIVFAKGNDLFLAESDGSHPRKLVTAPGIPSGPRWRPDGERLRFTVEVQPLRTSALWEVSADGTNLHRVLPTWTDSHRDGDWTPNGNYFVFKRIQNGQMNLWLIPERRGLFRKRSSEPVQLTFGPTSIWSFVPARDSRKIFAVGVQFRGELTRYDHNIRQFVPYMSGISATYVDFSRDGEWVTYVTIPGGNLWRSRADGSERLQLTFPPMGVMVPRWSPDRIRIAFMGRVPGEPWRIYVVPAEGGGPVQLIEGGGDESDPQWSADGNSILFGRAPPVLQVQEPLVLKVFNFETKRVTALPGSEGLWSPRWSPDRRHIAALMGPALVLYDLKTLRHQLLATGMVGYPNWSKDGKFLYYSNVSSDGPTVFRVNVQSHKIEKLLTNLEKFQFGSDLGLGLAPDDSPILFRNTSIEEIYAFEMEAP